MKRSVLVVDDEPNIVLTLEILLQEEGYDVRTACDGEQALRAASERRPDVVLLDITMPVRDGYSVCAAMRADPVMGDVHIVMLSAHSRTSDQAKAFALGVQWHPEWKVMDNPFSRALFAAFGQAGRERAARRAA